MSNITPKKKLPNFSQNSGKKTAKTTAPPPKRGKTWAKLFCHQRTWQDSKNDRKGKSKNQKRSLAHSDRNIDKRQKEKNGSKTTTKKRQKESLPNIFERIEEVYYNLN